MNSLMLYGKSLVFVKYFEFEILKTFMDLVKTFIENLYFAHNSLLKRDYRIFVMDKINNIVINAKA